MVEALLGCKGGERREQILAQRAADTAVGELDHLLLLLQHSAATHELRVDIHRRHVVDDDGDAVAVAVVQQVIEQRRLAGPEEARQHSHRQRLRQSGRRLGEAGAAAADGRRR